MKTQLFPARKPHIGQVLQDCTGCGCCEAVCPELAISMTRHPEGGFLFPSVKESACIGCGSCLKLCPSQKENNHYRLPLKAACAWHQDARILSGSTSGGVFRALADMVLSEGGLVIDVKFTDGYRGVTYTSSDESPVDEMQGSKYIAPDPSGIAARVKEALDCQRQVLFAGAPCHVSGILNLVGRHEKLLCCDFICRGMPAPDAYQAHLKALEKAERSSVEKVEFRSKADGWNRSKVRYYLRSGKIINIRKGFRDSYYHCFALSHVNVRECCTDCHFSEAHTADITMGDYWNYRFSGIPKNRSGMSLVLANTEKGLEFMDRLKQEMTLYPLPKEEGAAALTKTDDPDKNRRERNSYFSMARRIGYEEAAGSFISTGYFPNMLRKLRHIRRHL